jgi:hypothetical protein
MIKALSGRLAAVVAIAVTLTALSLPHAGAASWKCMQASNRGVTCGSQQLVDFSLMLAAHNNLARNDAVEVKAASSGTTTSPGNATEDFRPLTTPDPPTTGAGAFAYAPGSHLSGRCLTRAGLAVRLLRCDLDAWAQQWTADESSGLGYMILARGTDLAITAAGRAYVNVTLAEARNTRGQLWGFNGLPRLSAAGRAGLHLAG